MPSSSSPPAPSPAAARAPSLPDPSKILSAASGAVQMGKSAVTAAASAASAATAAARDTTTAAAAAVHTTAASAAAAGHRTAAATATVLADRALNGPVMRAESSIPEGHDDRIAHLILEFAATANRMQDYETRDLVCRKLASRGLRFFAFYRAGLPVPPATERNVFVKVWAPKERLLEEARRLGFGFQLDPTWLHEADGARNFAERRRFDFDGDYQIRQSGLCWTKGLRPYEFIYAHLVPAGPEDFGYPKPVDSAAAAGLGPDGFPATPVASSSALLTGGAKAADGGEAAASRHLAPPFDPYFRYLKNVKTQTVPSQAEALILLRSIIEHDEPPPPLEDLPEPGNEKGGAGAAAGASAAPQSSWFKAWAPHIRHAQRIKAKFFGRDFQGLNLDSMVHDGVLRQWFPGHSHPDDLREVQASWRATLRISNLDAMRADFERIRHYMGERIAFLIALQDSFVRLLVWAAILGLAAFIHQRRLGTFSIPWLPIYAILSALWSTAFYELWKRKQSKWALLWGKVDFSAHEPLRPEYEAAHSVEKSPVTGRMDYPRTPNPFWFRSKITLSGLTTSLGVGCVVIVVWSIFVLRVLLSQREQRAGGRIPDGWGNHITSIVNAAQVQVMNAVYSNVAHALTKWENHPTKSAHNNALTYKLAAFTFISSYFNLFYLAFIKASVTIAGEPQRCERDDCYGELQTQLAFMLVSNFATGLILAYVVPPIAYAVRWIRAFVLSAWFGNSTDWDVQVLVSKQAQLGAIQRDAQLSEYDVQKAYNDFFIRFGFTTLFVVALPLAPLITLVVASLEKSLLAGKTLEMFRRPMPEGAEDIGAWGLCFEAMAIVSVMSNLGIALFTNTGDLFGRSFSSYERLVFFVVAQNILLLVRSGLASAIPDSTRSTTVQLERTHHLVGRLIDKKGVDAAEDDAAAAGSGSGSGSKVQQRAPAPDLRVLPTEPGDDFLPARDLAKALGEAGMSAVVVVAGGGGGGEDGGETVLANPLRIAAAMRELDPRRIEKHASV
jgi:hypothetical protein